MPTDVRTAFSVRISERPDVPPIVVGIRGTVGINPPRVPRIVLMHTPRPVNGPEIDLPQLWRAARAAVRGEPR